MSAFAALRKGIDVASAEFDERVDRLAATLGLEAAARLCDVRTTRAQAENLAERWPDQAEEILLLFDDARLFHQMLWIIAIATATRK